MYKIEKRSKNEAKSDESNQNETEDMNDALRRKASLGNYHERLNYSFKENRITRRYLVLYTKSKKSYSNNNLTLTLPTKKRLNPS